MMISPPTESPSRRDMPLATKRMMTKGLTKKRRRLVRAAKRDSWIKLFEPWRRNRRFASSEVSPPGVAWSNSSSSGCGLFQKSFKGVVGVSVRIVPASTMAISALGWRYSRPSASLASITSTLPTRKAVDGKRKRRR